MLSAVIKITKLLDENHISQKALADYLNIPASRISEWKKGKSSSYKDYINQISDFFNLPASYFFDGQVDYSFSSDEISLLQTYRTLSTSGKQYILGRAKELYDLEISQKLTRPTIQLKHCLLKVSAGEGYILDDTDNFDMLTIDKTYYSERADFCVTIQGDSMLPEYKDGDIVLVKEQSNIDIGQVGIFTQDGKGYIKEKGRDRLISLNPEYDDISPSEYTETKCIGLVIGKI